jgi:hypothetical protein
LFALVIRRPVVTGVLIALAVVLVLVPGSAARGTDPMAPATAPPAVPSVGIPMTEVATRAAQLPDVLRSLTNAMAPSGELETIRQRLPELRQRFDLELATLGTLLRSQPTLDMLQTQQQLWQRRQLEGSRWLSMLTLRATHLQKALGRLAEIETTWRQTLDTAVGPEPRTNSSRRSTRLWPPSTRPGRRSRQSAPGSWTFKAPLPRT